MIDSRWKPICVHCLEELDIPAEEDRYDLPDQYVECDACSAGTNPVFAKLILRFRK